MMNRVATYAQVIAFVMVIAVAAVVLQFWPANYWITLRSLHIESGKPSDALKVLLDRTVNHEFVGTRIVNIDRWNGTEWIRVCATSVQTTFVPGNRLPINVRLGVASTACHPLEAGSHRALMTWVIEVPGLMPNKVASIQSNIFEVTP